MGYNATVGAGSWGQIYLDRVITANEFVYCDFINGCSRIDQQNSQGIVELSDAKAVISYCAISGSKVYGISLRDDFTLTAFDHNTVENCAEEPVTMCGQLARLDKFDVTSDFTGNPKPYIHLYVAYVNEAATLHETAFRII